VFFQMSAMISSSVVCNVVQRTTKPSDSIDMQTRLCLRLMLVLSAVVAAHPQEPTNSSAIPAASIAGARIFSSTCASCHGLDGRGGERAPDIASRRDVQKLTNATLTRIIREGVPGTGMPSFRSLGTVKIQSVVQHLRELQGRSRTARVPGSAVAGGSIFFGKAACSECHVVNGEGGFLGADLSGYAQGKSAEQIRAAITNPKQRGNGRLGKVVVTTSDGKTLVGLARNEDNFSLQLQTLGGAFHFLDKSRLQKVEHRPESLMPSDYGSKLSSKELDDLVSYLVVVARKTQSEPKPTTNKTKQPRAHSAH
jgi:cytochrome c oxidase cbb3-type subunit III